MKSSKELKEFIKGKSWDLSSPEWRDIQLKFHNALTAERNGLASLEEAKKDSKPKVKSTKAS